jgi:hypothetical protein
MRFGERPEIFDVSAALRERAERYRAQNQPRERDLKRLFTLRLAQVPRVGEVIKRRARRTECSVGEWGIAEELAGEDLRLVTVEGGTGAVTAEVAHEQILRKWPTLEGWLNELRDFLTWKADLEAARADHEKAPAAEKAGALLSGQRLLIARNWLATHGDDLALEDQSFVEASIKADDEICESTKERERKRQEAELALARSREREALAEAKGAQAAAGAAKAMFRRTVIAALIVISIVGSAGWWTLNQKAEADHQRNQALLRESQLLTKLAESQIENKDFGAAALLALEALPDRRSGNPVRSTRPLWAPAEIALNLALWESQEQLILPCERYHRRRLQPRWGAHPHRLWGQYRAGVGRQDGRRAFRPQRPYGLCHRRGLQPRWRAPSHRLWGQYRAGV